MALHAIIPASLPKYGDADNCVVKESEITLNQDVLNCPICSRRTPAARGVCIYCGAALPVTEIHAAPHQRNIEPFERAFNTILLPAGASSDSKDAALASALGIELDQARGFVAALRPLPIARSQTRQEAEMISQLARNCGLRATVVADEDLRLETPLTRARRILRRGDQFEVHHVGGALAIPASALKLMVIGALKNIRVDYTEASPVASEKVNVLDTAEFRSEETLLDVYASSLEESFRIKADAFDYSSLVEKLSFRAEENFQSVIRNLCGAAPQAKLDMEFARMRGLLARAWPERSHNEAQGIKRTGASYRPVSKSSIISDNRDQFERYSRLMFLMSQT
jgi:hypothetical protein